MNGKKTEREKPVHRWDVDGRFASNANNILLLSVSVRPKRRQAYSLVCPTKFIRTMDRRSADEREGNIAWMAMRESWNVVERAHNVPCLRTHLAAGLQATTYDINSQNN